MNAAVIKELIAKIFRFGPTIAIGNVVLTLFGSRIPTYMAHRLSEIRYKKIKSALNPLVDKVLSQSDNLSKPVIKSNDYQNTIWVCWLQGEHTMPEITRLCLESIRRNSDGRKVVLLTYDNLYQYVTINKIIKERYNAGLIKHCHFADIIRINILAQRGGLWLDATIFQQRPLNPDIFKMPFFSVRTIPFGHFVSRCRWAVFCIGAPAGSRLFVLLSRLFDLYLQNENYFIDYFLFDTFIDMLYERDPGIKADIDSIPFNNPHIYSLNQRLTEQFSQEEWTEMTADTSLFKLNWKKYSDHILKSSYTDTFYNHINASIE